MTYSHRYDESRTAHVSHSEALVHAAGIADTWAKECDGPTHEKITRLYAEASTDAEHAEIVAIYNAAREGDESITIEELTIE